MFTVFWTKGYFPNIQRVPKINNKKFSWNTG